MKEKATILVIAYLMFGVFTCSLCFADDETEIGIDTVASFTGTTGLQISDGKASCTGEVNGKPGKAVTQTTIHLWLQKRDNGSWKNIGDWSDSSNSSKLLLKKSKAISRGYSYRTKAVMSATTKGKIEKTTKYRKVIFY